MVDVVFYLHGYCHHSSSSQAELIPIKKKFRFDVVIGEDLRPWLLEVNYSPDMVRRTGVDKKVHRYCFVTHFTISAFGFSKPQKGISLGWLLFSSMSFYFSGG